MTVPTEADIKKKQAELEGFLRQINPDGSLPEEKALAFVLRAVRKTWITVSPTKRAYLELGRIPDMNPNSRKKWLCQCEKCKGMFKMDEIQIDHKKGGHQFKVRADFENYLEKVLLVNFEGLQRLCHECHATKTQLELMGLDTEKEEDWATARLEKQVLAICKGKGSPEKAFLAEHGVTPANNINARKEQIRKILIDQSGE